MEILLLHNESHFSRSRAGGRQAAIKRALKTKTPRREANVNFNRSDDALKYVKEARR